MMADKEMFDELMITLAPKVFDECVAQKINESDDKYEFVNAVGRKTAFLAKQLVIERNRILHRGSEAFTPRQHDS